MTNNWHRYFILFVGMLMQVSVCVGKSVPDNLKCELLVNPTAIDCAQPRLSWELNDDQRGTLQTWYHILVASSAEKLLKNEGDLWDSKNIASDSSVFILYKGRNLESRTKCYWKVQVGTNNGISQWSKPAKWAIGLLEEKEWNAKWTGLDRAFEWDQPDSIHTRLSARYFRKEFTAEKTIKKAIIYVSGLGLYNLEINGSKIGTQVLSPSPTDYTKSVKYNAFDVTESIAKGNNAIGVTLGNGRFFTMRYRDKYYAPGAHWLYNNKHFGFPKMILQLEIEYADGTKQTVVSDDTWKVTADGPIRSNSEFDGEEYDARKEMRGWNKVGFDDSAWLKAELVKSPGGKLEAQMNNNIQVMQGLKPRSIKPVANQKFIMDMGQNMVGFLRIKVKGKEGQTIHLRYAETLKPDGNLYMDNIREAYVTDKYTLKGNATENWEPKFTYHGFRYVELTGFTSQPNLADFEGCVVYDEMENTGKFETSDTTLNQIYSNAYWGIRGNYRGMPTDCPQRDERMGWLGDRATGSYGESFIFGNNNLYAKWLDDIEQAQRPNGSIPDVAPNYWDAYNDNMTWPGAYVIIANMLYNQYGNLAPIAKHYNSMKKWMDYMRVNFLKEGIMTKDTYGDWCMPPERLDMIFSEDSTRKTDGILIGTAFYYHLAGLMNKFAVLLDKRADADDFATQAEEVRQAFNEKFFNKNNSCYSNNTVTANLIPLCFNMVPAEFEAGVMNNIVTKTETVFNSHVSVGLIGIQWLMRGLSGHGRPDLAYRIASNRDYPGWGYMAASGATTIWELWNGNTADPAMNSGNHVMLLGDLIIWCYESLAGIKNKAGHTGFHQIEMHPYFIDRLSHVTASYHSVHGWIKSAWKRKGTTIGWNITVPANTTATIYFPTADNNAVTEGGEQLSNLKCAKFLRTEGGSSVFEIGSGNYSFNIK